MANLINYVPEILSEFEEFKKLTEAEQPEIDALWVVIDDVMNDQFIADATENGVNRWESILKITPKGTDTIEDRKFRINARLNEKLPYTERTLHEKLVNLCGEDYTMVTDYDTYTVTVRIALAKQEQFAEVHSLLKRTVPANMVINLSVLYNTHEVLSQFTHAQLSAYTHDQLRKEVF